MPTPYALSSDLVSAWPAKSLEVATYLDTSLAAKTDLAMVQNAQTGTSYSYALADASKLLTMSNAASNTVLVTKQATVTWAADTQLRVLNLGAGTTTLVADTGVTINNNTALARWNAGVLIRMSSDVWTFVPSAAGGGAWTAFTPSWTNLTVGNGTNVAAYSQSGKTVTVRFAFILGSTSSVGTTPRFNLPVTAATQYSTYPTAFLTGNVSLNDSGTNTFTGLALMWNTTEIAVMAQNSSATYVTWGSSGVTATVPFTWTTGDGIYGQFYYEAA